MIVLPSIAKYSDKFYTCLPSNSVLAYYTYLNQPEEQAMLLLALLLHEGYETGLYCHYRYFQ